ncbi:MAG: polyamine aminopropyltransferase [Chitinispirillia bacterium]|jgi:spermidine synthase
MNATTAAKSEILISRLSIALITLLMGGCGIAYEYTFSKIASDLLGNSIQQWAIIIGIMMFCMGIGSDIQKYISDKNLFDRFILFEVILGLLGGFGPIFLIYIFGISRDHFALVQYFLTIITGLLIGLEIPVLTRINERFTPQLKLNIGGILRMDYIGAFIGALAWLFVLLHYFSLTQTGFILGLINNLVAGVALIYFMKYARQKIILSIIVSLSITALIFGMVNAPLWTEYAEQKLFLNRVIFSKTTPYQHVVLTKRQSGDISCYINGHLQFSSSDEFIYHEYLVHPAMLLSATKKNVLILGGGDGLAAREVLKYDMLESVTIVDIDPEITQMAMNNPHIVTMNEGSLQNAKVKIINNKEISPGETRQIFLKNRARPLLNEYEEVSTVSIINMDAVKFVEQARGFYDIVIMDFPDPNSLELSKLYSKSFYKKIYEKLNRNGVIVQQSSSPFFTQKAFLCIGKTMKDAGFSAIPFHDNVPSFGEWGWWIGCKSDYISEKKLKQKFLSLNAIPVKTKYLHAALLAGSTVFAKNFGSNEEIKINNIFNNIIYKYYIDELKNYY